MKVNKNCTNSKNSTTKGCSSTKGCKSTKATKNSTGRTTDKKASDSESDSDPFGSYTGNPVGFGKHEKPTQDADDL